jgi:hypothetical protein
VILTALFGAVGGALFAWLVWRVGPSEIWNGFRQIGWGLAIIVLLGGLRFAARAFAWTLCIEPPHRLQFRHALNAVICGDTLGNVIPLGPFISEAAKLACVRGRVPVAAALTALAIENILYTLSVAAMIAGATMALLFSFELQPQLRGFSEVALGGIFFLFGLALWMLWRRPTLVGLLPAALRPDPTSRMHSRLERIRGVELEVYSFAARRRWAVAPVVAAELVFHALGVLEAYLTLWMITGSWQPVMVAFIIEGANRLFAVAFKFVPFQVGVGEAGTGLLTELLGLGSPTGVTLSLARKVRMVVWAMVGTVLLVHQGLTTKRILEEASIESPNGPGQPVA